MKKTIAFTVAAAFVVLSGCGGAKEQTSNKEEAKESAKNEPAGLGGTATPDLSNGATVTGKVSFTGDKPVLRTIDMSANPACQRMHHSPQKSEEAVVNGNGTLRYVFVWVKTGLPGDKTWATPTTPVQLAQKGCMYDPHVIGVMTGQPIDIKNDDDTNHNIHPLPTVNQEWNESQPPKGEDKMKSFPREELMIPVKCNVHPWMRAYISVVSHPFFAVTGDDGTFTIKGLPPGSYTIEAIHEKYGKMEMPVTVGAKESKTVDFSFKG